MEKHKYENDLILHKYKSKTFQVSSSGTKIHIV